MGFRVLAYVAVGAHFAFLAFGVLGGFLAWRWPRLIWLHVAGVAWLVLIVTAQLSCPLTWIEDRARERAGMAPTPGGFIANHVAGLFFPHGHQPAAMVAVGLTVLISWAGFAARRRRDVKIGHGVPKGRSGLTRLR
jgi:hypothetical protein